MQMYNSEYLQEKWAPILDYDGLDPIKDAHRRSVTAILLENQEKELREERSFLSEAPTVNTNSGANAGFSADAAAGGTGGNSVANKLFWEHEQTVTHDYTITAARNAGSFGPITINNGVTVTIPNNSNWTIL